MSWSRELTTTFDVAFEIFDLIWPYYKKILAADSCYLLMFYFKVAFWFVKVNLLIYLIKISKTCFYYLLYLKAHNWRQYSA